jgi:putative endonuclease
MHSGSHRSFFVYIMSNRSKTLYVGITNNLLRRVWQHKKRMGSEFCIQYKLDRLVYFERFQYVDNAIARESRLKAGCESRKSR